MLTIGGWYLIVMINGHAWRHFEPRPMDGLQDCLNHAPAWERQFSTAAMNPVCVNVTTRELVDNVRGTTKAGDRYTLRGARKEP